MIRKLQRLAPLTDADVRALRDLPVRIAQVPNGQYLVREGHVVTECCVLVSGYAARSKVAAGGGRQIVSFHMAGDILDLQNLLLDPADHNVQAITAATVLWVPMRSMKSLADGHPNILHAFWRDTLIDASIFREWVLNVGRRGARSRVAHMLCEFAVRREAAGLGAPQSFELPMTQEEIADATGLTPVHVNRMLQALGSDGLISRRGRQVTIIDWDGFRRAADFDPLYLHQAA